MNRMAPERSSQSIFSTQGIALRIVRGLQFAAERYYKEASIRNVSGPRNQP
jgi:hypothetical protein